MEHMKTVLVPEEIFWKQQKIPIYNYLHIFPTYLSMNREMNVLEVEQGSIILDFTT